MYSPMSSHERRVILSLVALLVVALVVTIVGIYRATVIFEDGSFILPNGWSGCIPWEVCFR